MFLQDSDRLLKSQNLVLFAKGSEKTNSCRTADMQKQKQICLQCGGTEKPYNPFENVQTVMEEAMEVGGIDRTMFEIIRNPQRETKVYLPVEMDDGSIHVFEGWRVQHSNIRGPL